MKSNAKTMQSVAAELTFNIILVSNQLNAQTLNLYTGRPPTGVMIAELYNTLLTS